jgi:CBS domain-containing protein
VQLGLRGAGGDTGHLGNLLVLEPFDIVEDEDPAGPVRQPGNGLVEIRRRGSLGACLGDGIEQVEILRRFMATPPAPAPESPHHLVDRDPVEPGGEGALPAVAAELLPRSHEDVLGQFLGQHSVAREPETEGVHPPNVRVIQHPEGGRISGLGGANGISHGNGIPLDPAGFEWNATQNLEWGTGRASSAGIHPPFRRSGVNYLRGNDPVKEGKMRVRDLMQTEVISIDAADPIRRAVELLVDGHVSGLPVVEGHGKLVGAISGADILQAESGLDEPEAIARLFQETQVREVMTPRPETISPDATIREAAQRLLYLEVHRLFVEHDGHLVGVISTSDLVREMAGAIR